MKFCKDCKHYAGKVEERVWYGMTTDRHQCAHPKNIRFRDPVTGEAYTLLPAHENRGPPTRKVHDYVPDTTLLGRLLRRKVMVTTEAPTDPTCGPEGDWFEPTKVAD